MLFQEGQFEPWIIPMIVGAIVGLTAGIATSLVNYWIAKNTERNRQYLQLATSIYDELRKEYLLPLWAIVNSITSHQNPQVEDIHILTEKLLALQQTGMLIYCPLFIRNAVTDLITRLKADHGWDSEETLAKITDLEKKVARFLKEIEPAKLKGQ